MNEETQVPAGDGVVLPCPFCGSPAAEHEYEEESLHSHSIVPYLQISCDECDCAFAAGEDFADVRRRWNRRAPLISLCEGDGSISSARDLAQGPEPLTVPEGAVHADRSEAARCIDTSFGSDRWTCDGEWHRGWCGHDPYAERCPKSGGR